MAAEWQIIQGDCLEVMRGMESDSFDLIATDPPYFKVKGEAWDNQWDKPGEFIAWIGQLCEQWQRLLKPNGSLYVFASPQMRARVEVEVGRWFECLPTITWSKPKSQGKWQQASKESLRSYFPSSEAIIFAEHHNSDNIAKGEAQYVSKCDELRGVVFEPLRAYLDGERERAGVTRGQINKAWQVWKGSPSGGMAGHWFSRVQWALPTEDNYNWIRATLHQLNGGGEYLKKDYEYLRKEYEDLRKEYEDLRKEYEDLRKEYEDLRRPFNVTPDVPFTDVWTFPTVSDYPGKHICEKPISMMRHIVEASSRDGATVLDCFLGSGVSGAAAVELGRNFVGIEQDARWCRIASGRISEAANHLFANL